MKVKKVEIFQNKVGFTGCKWSNLNAPSTETSLSQAHFEVFPFPIFSKARERVVG